MTKTYCDLCGKEGVILKTETIDTKYNKSIQRNSSNKVEIKWCTNKKEVEICEECSTKIKQAKALAGIQAYEDIMTKPTILIPYIAEKEKPLAEDQTVDWKSLITPITLVPYATPKGKAIPEEHLKFLTSISSEQMDLYKGIMNFTNYLSEAMKSIKEMDSELTDLHMVKEETEYQNALKKQSDAIESIEKLRTWTEDHSGK